jgi:hypothetical protein
MLFFMYVAIVDYISSERDLNPYFFNNSLDEFIASTAAGITPVAIDKIFD